MFIYFTKNSHICYNIREVGDYVKILVVDDEMLIRNVVREYMALESYEVEEASDGDEAINLFRNNDYDLVIMDVMMPKKDGFQTVK